MKSKCEYKIITTSWDDGHPKDAKLAELLDKYKIEGTFYIPVNNPEREVMDIPQLKGLSEAFEIGCHTVNHTFLKYADDATARKEIFNSKEIIEDTISKPVYGFCFPGGKYTKRDINLLKEAGFLYARTTKLLKTTLNNDFLMSTTIQAYNHSFKTLYKHCLKNFNILPIVKLGLFTKYDKNFLNLFYKYMVQLEETGGVLHLWGHSWEIDKFNLWNDLSEIFKVIASCPHIKRMNNSETWKLCKNIKLHGSGVYEDINNS